MTKQSLIKQTAAVLFAFGCIFSAGAQVDKSPPVAVPALQNADSINNQPVKKDQSVVLQKQYSFDDVDFPEYNDSIIAQRIKNIQTCIPLDYNDQVRKQIDFYVQKRRNSVSIMAGLSKVYFPVFDQVFSSYGLPCELKYLAIIESALNPKAVSWCGATGMWQFMYNTGKLYGLQINGYVDEREDLWKATDAAARYLKDGYDRYGDWLLAIASYNCGAGVVDWAVEKSGGKCNFWEVAKYLPYETRSYVPSFIAAAYVMNYYELHNIYPTAADYSFASISPVVIDSRIGFDQLSKFTDISMDELKFLNPGYKTNLVPADNSSYTIALPTDKLPVFDAKKDSIVLLSKSSSPVYYTASNNPYTAGYINYYVQPGQSLGLIAQYYGVSVYQIKAWNNLYSDLIYPNQRLVIYTSSASTPVQPVASTTSTKATTPVKSNAAGNVVYYKVKYGDTLWGITQQYKGLTIDSIKASNPDKAYNLQPGMVLKLSIQP